MDTSVPLFSVIIPTCGRKELLGVCLQRLTPDVQNFSAQQYEIIVSDDSGRAGILDSIAQQYTDVQYVTSLARGPSANRNTGVRYARGTWLVFVDDDVVCPPDFLQIYVRAIMRFPCAVGWYGLYACTGPANMWSIQQGRMSGFFGGNCVVRRDIFERVGGFREELRRHEDIRLWRDISMFGHVRFDSQAIVEHPIRRLSFFQFWRQACEDVHYVHISYVDQVTGNNRFTRVADSIVQKWHNAQVYRVRHYHAYFLGWVCRIIQVMIRYVIIAVWYHVVLIWGKKGLREEAQ